MKLLLFDFVDLLEKLPADMKVLVLHGQADQIIPFECSQVNKAFSVVSACSLCFQEILRRIPSARFVEIGPESGKLPTLQFGHNFTLYFPVKIWDDLVKEFLRDPEPMVPPSPEPDVSVTEEPATTEVVPTRHHVNSESPTTKPATDWATSP